MGNILVIEPRKLLQHATAIALFPEHEARIVEEIPTAAEVQDFDAVVIDAAALREGRGISAEALLAMEGWSTPMVWVDGDSSQVPKRDKLVVVKRPVSRDAMRAALAQCLAPAVRPRPVEATVAEVQPSGRHVFTTKTREPRIIELLEVVEEGPTDAPARGEKKKKK